MIGFRVEKDIEERIQRVLRKTTRKKSEFARTAILTYLVEQERLLSLLDKKQPNADSKSVLERAQETGLFPSKPRRERSKQTS
jgi:predicted transcriptional regulator